MSGKMTEKGRKKLGALIAKARLDNGYTSQQQFADWLTAESKRLHGDDYVEVTESVIRLLEAATYQRSPNFDALYAILDAKVLVREDGEPFDFADVAAVLREESYAPTND